MSISYAQLKYPMLPVEAVVLGEVTIRLINPGTERERYDQWIIDEHYLKNAEAVGEVLRYVAEYRGQWVALLTFCSAAYPIKARDQYLHWSARQVRARRHLMAQNSRFLVLPGTGKWPNLASRLLKRVSQVIAQDWQHHFGHPVLALETFVDPQHFRGTCYKAAGWEALGGTQGYERRGQDFYGETKHPKELWIKPLGASALERLRAAELPPELRSSISLPPPAPTIASQAMNSFWQFARHQLPDLRDPHGVRHPLPSMVAIVALAVAAGCQGWEAIADFAKSLNHAQRRRLRCRVRSGKLNEYEVPCHRTFVRVFNKLPPDNFAKLIAEWMAHLDKTPVDILHLEGKVVKRATAAPPRLNEDPQLAAAAAAVDPPAAEPKPQADKMLTLVNFQTPNQRLIDPIAVPSDTNEEAAVAAHWPKLDLGGVTVIADAAHTTKANGHHLARDQGADFIFFLKGNQPTAFEQAKKLLPESLPPSGGNDR